MARTHDSVRDELFLPCTAEMTVEAKAGRLFDISCWEEAIRKIVLMADADGDEANSEDKNDISEG